MFYKTQISKVGIGYAVDVFGKRLSFIGNYPCRAGDTVWTDGRVIFGNFSVKSAPVFFPPVTGGIPVIMGFFNNRNGGYFDKNGNFKNYHIAFSDDDNFVVNNGNYFLHGFSDAPFVDISDDGNLLSAIVVQNYLYKQEYYSDIEYRDCKITIQKSNKAIANITASFRSLCDKTEDFVQQGIVRAVTFLPNDDFQILFTVINSAYSVATRDHWSREPILIIEQNYQHLIEIAAKYPAVYRWEPVEEDYGEYSLVGYFWTHYFKEYGDEQNATPYEVNFVIYDSKKGFSVCEDSFFFPLQNDFSIHYTRTSKLKFNVDGIFYQDSKTNIPTDILNPLTGSRYPLVAKLNDGYLVGYRFDALYKIKNGSAESVGVYLHNHCLRQLKDISKARR